jgi:hypothetical protein
MTKERIGSAAVITGMVGALFGVGVIEGSMDTSMLLVGVGISFVSAMSMYTGLLLVRDEI